MKKQIICYLLILTAGMLWLPALVIAQNEDPVAPGLTIHVVQRGENLFRIALDYGLTPDELAQLNGITNPDNLLVGQRLLVPSTPVEPEAQTHIVQAGETLRSIADLYGKTVEELAQINGIADPDTLFIGQILELQPGSIDAPIETAPTVPNTATSAPQSVFHIVQSGETLFRIATSYGLSVNELAAANGIGDPTLIFAGQQLIIPGIQPPQFAVDLPTPITHLEVDPVFFVEGGTGSIQITTSEAVTLSGTFMNRELRIISTQNNQQHSMLVGIPAFTEPAIYPAALKLTHSAGAQIDFTFNIQVLSGGYGSQTINLPEDKLVLLAPAVEEYELNLLSNLTSQLTPEKYFNGSFSLPVAAAMNSAYGIRRSYNGGPFDRYHNGADFAGAPGVPVLAAAPGIVVLADLLNIRGVITVIDHGWGVFTSYSHQTERYVNLGQFVNTGDIIGTVGASGRATGAHLHWEVWVNGIAVDPMQWTQRTFP